MGLPPLTAAPDPAGGDCLGCGRCCAHPPASVQLAGLDERRMSPRRLALYTEELERSPFSRFMKNVDERCAALDVSVPGRYPCAVYEERPDGCRIVMPGDAWCLEARALGHLRFGLGA